VQGRMFLFYTTDKSGPRPIWSADQRVAVMKVKREVYCWLSSSYTDKTFCSFMSSVHCSCMFNTIIKCVSAQRYLLLVLPAFLCLVALGTLQIVKCRVVSKKWIMNSNIDGSDHGPIWGRLNFPALNCKNREEPWKSPSFGTRKIKLKM
jgi:hypothetical protein